MHAADRRPAFPSTRWSRILTPGGQRDLDQLAREYWRPIQAWLAARVRCDDDRANDLAQEAFAWMLETGLLDKADPARGSFRGYLKCALANFVIEQHRIASAQKRGGGVAHRDLAAAPEVIDTSSKTPDQVLDEAWRRELLQRAETQLQAELEGGARATYYLLFRDYFLADGDEPDHATLAQRHGISKTDVANWLDHAKRRYRAILRQAVSDTVGNEEELQTELRWLFGAGGAGSR
jgi:DNA-directed RNA polymerase specialized sigma24 family protein